MNYKTNTKKSIFYKGFTLVEALVAISILLIAIESPMIIAQKGLLTATLSQNQATASFLAQDAMEAVKNLRDTTALNAVAGSGESWLAPFNGEDGVNCICNPTGCTNFANYCNIDTTVDPLTMVPLTSGSVNPMKIKTDGSGNFLGFVLGGAYANSIFSRKIDIVVNPANDNPNEAEVNVEVSWNEPSGQQSITLSDFIYNYSENL